jgi:hypothetical protein
LKNIKRLISSVLIIISAWIIRERPFYLLAEYPMVASILMSLIIYLSFALGLSTFSSENRTLDKIRVTIIVLSLIGIFPGIYFNYFYFKKAKDSFLLREGIMGKAIVTDRKIQTRAEKNLEHTDYELYFSFLTSEKITSQSWDVLSEKEFQAVNVGDSVNVIYLPKRCEFVELIIGQGDRTFYGKKLKPNR